MTKSVRLIRHGESAANVGAPSIDHASIPLTERGIEQARQVAMSFSVAPDLIVTSPFSRAHATASWTAAEFPSVKMEIWLVHEFTYLEPAKCANTTIQQRRRWVDAYWNRADPTHVDGDGAESFAGFVHRARVFLDLLAQQMEENIVVFSHGQFINAVAWLIERQPAEISSRAMKDWREYEIANHVENCAGYLLTHDAESSHWKLASKS